MVFRIGKRLRRGHNDALAGMDAQRVEVFHIADRDAVVVAVAHDLVFDLFPAFQRLFDQNLRRVRKRFVRQRVQFLVVVAETRSEAAERIGRADNHRITQLVRHPFGFGNGCYRFAFDRPDVDFVEFFDEFLAVFGVDDRLHGSAQHAYAVFFQYAALVELDAAVQRRLAAEGEQDALRPLLFDNLFDVFGRHR